MKKWIIVPTALIAATLLAIYIFVPKKIHLSQTVTINCTHAAANRYLVNDSNWFKWWPTNASVQAKAQSQANTFPYKTFSFEPHQKMFDAIGVRINADDLTINSMIILIPKHTDSVSIQWNLDYYTGTNPVTRVQRYQQAGTLRTEINDILARLKLFLEKTEHVYGIVIKKTTVKDTLLLSTKKVFDSFPTTQNTYSLINKLKTHIQQQGATVTGYPMLNIQQKDNTHFETMVAIPVNKAVKEQNDLVIKKMVPGNLLVAEVSGGEHTISNAFAQMENYVIDHNFESPAIPFYSLITDRIAESDTSKWVTRISYPVF
jgi:effector-binding domain-containing protein